MSNWQRIWNENGSNSRYSPIKTITYVLSLLYRLIISLRNWLYDQNYLQEVKLSCPVISVGNITVGGTGKTPCVIMLAQMLKTNGFKPAVLSRGYGSKGSQPVNIVSDGSNILLAGEVAGDEPLLMAQALKGIPVITGPRRILTGQTAIDKFGADILICDDAFQHRQIHRDVDLVLLDSRYPLGNGEVLPRGSLREPAIGLRRAHAFILTRTNEAMETSGIINKLAEAKNIPIFKSIHQPNDLVAGDYNTRFPLSQLKGKKVYAFAGIANPGSFKRVLNETEAQILLFDEFSDHYQYKLADVEQIRKKFSDSGADYLITTEKDGMRLRKFAEFFNTLYLLHIEMAMIPDKKSLENFLREKIEAAK